MAYSTSTNASSVTFSSSSYYIVPWILLVAIAATPPAPLVVAFDVVPRACRIPTPTSSRIASVVRRGSTGGNYSVHRQRATRTTTTTTRLGLGKDSNDVDADDGGGGDDVDDRPAENIPRTGYSLADKMERNAEDGERFVTTLTPLIDAHPSFTSSMMSATTTTTTKTKTTTAMGSGSRRTKGGATLEFRYDASGFPVGYAEAISEDGGGKEEGEEDDDGGGIDEHDDIDDCGVARIDTISTLGDAGEEPARWLVSMGICAGGSNDDCDRGEGGIQEGGGGIDDDQTAVAAAMESYAMIDLPPYSDGLADEIRGYMNRPYRACDDDDVVVGTSEGGDGNGAGRRRTRRGKLDVILITNRQCVHYDASPGVYVTRKSDLGRWRAAFPDANVVMYRLDVPRECRGEITQVLDGYGPWGYDETRDGNGDGDGGGDRGGAFVETGRPLRIVEWDDDTKSRVLTRGETPPDDDDDGITSAAGIEEAVGGYDENVVVDDDDIDTVEDDSSMYTPDAIRKREGSYRLLAVYTPGHTFGSVTYVFPRRGICCSGYALPLDGSVDDIDDGINSYVDDDISDGASSSSSSPPTIGYGGGRSVPPPRGPRLDYRGYLATSASRPRQMSSALSLIDDYVDRFRVVLPARGDAVFLDQDADKRKRELMESVGLYKKIGDIYSRLGIVD